MNSRPASIRARRLALESLDPLDWSLELMYFGLKGLTREADDVLATHGLGRAHHRILFVIARRDGVTVGDLRSSLGISAQALHRPLKALLHEGHVAASRDPARHRYKALHLTDRGRALENDASERERAVLREALGRVDEADRRAWERVMAAVALNA